MTYSAVQLIAVSGVLQNNGIGVANSLTSRLNAIEDTTTLTGKLHRVVAHDSASTAVKNAARSILPGLCLVAPDSYTSLAAVVTPLDVTGSIRRRAQTLFQRGNNGFIGILSSAASSAASSREILGSLYALETNGFKGAAPDVANHIDLATGGLTSKFGPLAKGSQAYIKASGLLGTGASITTSPTDIKRSIVNVAEAISNMGTLYDFQDLTTVGTPIGLLSSLNKQGLIKTDLISQFENDGVDINNLSNSSSTILTSVLERITGTQLQRIVSAVGLTIPAGNILNTGADLLRADKIFTAAAVDAIPGGTIESMAKQLISLGVIFSNTRDLVYMMQNIIIPDNPLLFEQNVPVLTADADSIKAAIPTGTGEFGSALLEELVGTPAGYVHNDAIDDIFIALQSFASLAEAIDLGTAADTLFNVYNTSGTVASEETDFVAALTALKDKTAYTSYFETMDTAISAIVDRLVLEDQNCTKTGIDIYATVPGSWGVALAGLSFPQFGLDLSNVGVGNMLEQLATDNRFGQAIKASLIQGKNEQTLRKAGLGHVGIADISKLSRATNASAGAGLTLLQKENVSSDARERGLDIENALANASTYGYDNQYYMNRGYPSA